MYTLRKPMRAVLHGTSKRYSFGAYVPNKVGTMLVQGQGVFGALGHGCLEDADTFKRIHFPDSNVDKTKAIAAGWGHSAVVDASGDLHVFGRPYDFQNLMQIDKLYRLSKGLARYVAGSSNTLFGNVMGYFPSPTRIEGVGKVADVSASAGFTAFRTDRGEVYCFGINRWAQCGLDAKDNSFCFQPVKVPNLPPCRRVEAGLQHGIALTQEGDVFTWGKANKGQLGTASAPTTRDLPLWCPPTQVQLKDDPENVRQKSKKATHISAGFAHSAALTEDGCVYVWGRGMSAQEKGTDYGSVVASLRVCADQLLPRKVDLPGNRTAIDVVSSNFHVVILAADGSLWALGMGEHDRNANPLPLRVQTDFHFPASTTSTVETTVPGDVATAKLDPVDGKYYLVLPVPTMSAPTAVNSTKEKDKVAGAPPAMSLFRSHHRVAIAVREAAVDALAAQRTLQEASAQQSATGSSDIIRGPTTANRANFPSQGLFEVVVHEGEAYLIELVLPISAEDSARQYTLQNYTAGWKHSLMIVEEIADGACEKNQ